MESVYGMEITYKDIRIRNAGPADCEQPAAWWNQIGELQSSVDYELVPGDFVNYAK